MYAGHFAAALALKGAAPRAPTWGLLVGVGVADLLFGALVLAGVERVTATPGVAPGASLDFIDWSHSFATGALWAVLYAALFARHGRAVALAMSAAVYSHVLLDWPMHPGDLALWPHAEQHLGAGLWRSLPIGWWLVELAVIAAGCGFYAARARASGGAFGGRAGWAIAVVLVLHVINSPWLMAGG
ncbi:MAG TPA: hypothetical protein VMZ28_19020 [Kofleriaceae bacterium]|nr:hypothetical protein [Kofleriaceae bacterium]